MTGFLSGPAPRWFTIPAHRPFLDDLAGGIWRALSPLGVDSVSEAVVLVPNRRAARELAASFLAVAAPRAMLPPQIRALGDLDEDEPPFEAGDAALDLPPAIGVARRRFELAGLVAANAHLLDRSLDAGAALDLADALARFMDACQIEEVGEDIDLAALVEGDMALHWRRSVDFLDIALSAWPARLVELGLMDVAARRVALLRGLEARWRAAAPQGVLIAAGSTGSTTATADLLATIAAAPRGCVVLPGLDQSLADAAWDEVGDQHPQGALRRLLGRAGVSRESVKLWEGSVDRVDAGRWRRRLINEALRPAERTADWLGVIQDIRDEAPDDDPIARGLDGLSLITARSEEEAATAAALLLREALDTADRTATLVTPDAALGRRVIARLARWNITPDSSIGQPLAASPVGVLAALTARAIADPADPVALLAIVKHPLTRLGLAPAALDPASQALEIHGLRGARPGGWQALRTRLETALSRREDDRTNSTLPSWPTVSVGHPLGADLDVAPRPHDHPSSRVHGSPGLTPGDDGRVGNDRRRTPLLAALDLVGRLERALSAAGAPFQTAAATPARAARALAECLETLAGGPDGGTGGLWAGQAGAGLGAVVSTLIEESDALPEVTPAGFRDLLEGLLARELTRPGGASHPRLRVLGVLEARLLSSDLLILAGLEEGVWPAAAPIDPFLSRPMREKLGLAAPERRIGLAAHDFAQAACAPGVALLHSQRTGGAPTVESRWLWRLRTLIAGAKLAPPGRPEVLAWARALDAPIEHPPPGLRTASRPRPTPPVAARPRQLPVTAIERWVRDPYAIYAGRILRLRPLEPPDAPVEALARGSAIHRAFEEYARRFPDALPDEAEAIFEALVLEHLRAAGMPQAAMAREQALAANVAPWVASFERRRRPGARLVVEQSGALEFAAAAGPFTLTARADRIEVRGAEADILDFKTGSVPSSKQVQAGLAPQLTLTAAILAAGGFADLGPLAPRELLYVKVSGRKIAGSEEGRDKGDAGAMAEAALAGLKRRVAHFDDPETPYVSWSAPQFIGSSGDFDHLARLWEWHVIGEDEGGE